MISNWINSNSIEDGIIINSKVKIFRNIQGYKFPVNLETEEGRRLSEKVINILLDNVDGLKTINLWKDKEELDIYKEKGIITNSLLKNSDFSSFAINNDETFSVMINEKEHLGLQSVSNGNNLEEMYEYVNKIDDLIEDKLTYSFDNNIGYLTSDVSNIGTGLKTAVMVHLPVLSTNDEIANLLRGLNRAGISIEGMYGERGKSYGNIYIVSNEITLGVTEEEIINTLQNVIKNIVNEENRAREQMIAECNKELEDRIFRAYGILKNARILKWIEGLNLLSDLRLGVELSLLNINKDKLNKAIILTRDSILRGNVQDKISYRDLNIERAKVVRKLLE